MSIAPQRTDTPQPAYLRYTPPEQKLYTPVSVACYDPGNVAASNRKAEQTPPKALPNRIRNAGTAAAPRDLYYVQPEEYKGGITYREYGSVPEEVV